MTWNNLQFNDGKTEFEILGSKHHRKKVNITSIQVGNSKIESSLKVKNLGATFDAELNMHSHIDNMCKAARFQLRNISKISKCLDTSTLKTVIQAFVTSRLDQLNALLYGLPNTEIDKLQRIQNCAARLITKTRKHDHITPVLKQLHWLPIKYRIEFKILLLVFKALNGKGPSYLVDLLEPHSQRVGLRSNVDPLKLHEPRYNLDSYGARSFSCAAPRLWNKLPLAIRHSNSVESFKRNLKTHMFSIAFDTN